MFVTLEPSEKLDRLCTRYLGASRNYLLSPNPANRIEKRESCRDVIQALSALREITSGEFGSLDLSPDEYWKITFSPSERVRFSTSLKFWKTPRYVTQGHEFLIDRGGALHAIPVPQV